MNRKILFVLPLLVLLVSGCVNLTHYQAGYVQYNESKQEAFDKCVVLCDEVYQWSRNVPRLDECENHECACLC